MQSCFFAGHFVGAYVTGTMGDRFEEDKVQTAAIFKIWKKIYNVCITFATSRLWYFTVCGFKLVDFCHIEVRKINKDKDERPSDLLLDFLTLEYILFQLYIVWK